MSEVEKYLKMLQSEKASVRYEACEELRVATESSPEIILALEKAQNDADAGVAEVARDALDADVHQQMALKMGKTELLIQTERKEQSDLTNINIVFNPMSRFPALASFLTTISPYKWLFLAPLGLLMLPFLVGILCVFSLGGNPFDPSWPYLTNNFLWIDFYANDRWFFLQPFFGGIFLAALGFAGAKLKLRFLTFVSIGAYLIVLLYFIVWAVYPGQ